MDAVEPNGTDRSQVGGSATWAINVIARDGMFVHPLTAQESIGLKEEYQGGRYVRKPQTHPQMRGLKKEMEQNEQKNKKSGK